MNEITEAISKAPSRSHFAATCEVSRAATYKWEKLGRLPRTEWTEETNYSEKIYNAYGCAVSPFIPPEKTEATG